MPKGYICAIGEISDQFIDEDFEEDLTAAMILGNSFYNGFSIAPTNVYFQNVKKGILMEWQPYKPLIITSEEQYIHLYKSFAEFLESQPDGKDKDEEYCKNDFKDTKVKIYFRGLYLSEEYTFTENETSDLSPEYPKFDEYFKTVHMTAYTPNAIIKSKDDYLFTY